MFIFGLIVGIIIGDISMLITIALVTANREDKNDKLWENQKYDGWGNAQISCETEHKSYVLWWGIQKPTANKRIII